MKDPSETSYTEGSCPSGTLEEQEDSAIVAKGAGAAKTVIPSGWVFTAFACLNESGKVTEAKGAPATFQPAV